MKIRITALLAMLIIWGCSAPKYAYHFDTYDYNSGRKNTVEKPADISTESMSVLSVNPSTIEAGAADAQVPADIKSLREVDKSAVREKVASMTKSERSQLKKDVKEVLKKYSKVKKNDNDQVQKSTKEWDRDLKLAAIFGAVGIGLGLLSGVHSFFWVLSAVALIIAVVFLIKWLARQ